MPVFCLSIPCLGMFVRKHSGSLQDVYTLTLLKTLLPVQCLSSKYTPWYWSVRMDLGPFNLLLCQLCQQRDCRGITRGKGVASCLQPAAPTGTCRVCGFFSVQRPAVPRPAASARHLSLGSFITECLQSDTCP